jgi:hypothetical protein
MWRILEFDWGHGFQITNHPNLAILVLEFWLLGNLKYKKT